MGYWFRPSALWSLGSNIRRRRQAYIISQTVDGRTEYFGSNVIAVELGQLLTYCVWHRTVQHRAQLWPRRYGAAFIRFWSPSDQHGVIVAGKQILRHCEVPGVSESGQMEVEFRCSVDLHLILIPGALSPTCQLFLLSDATKAVSHGHRAHCRQIFRGR